MKNALPISIIVALVSTIWLFVFPRFVPHPGEIGADAYILLYLAGMLVAGAIFAYWLSCWLRDRQGR